MTQPDLLEQYATEFASHARQRRRGKRPKGPGHSGPLVGVFLPADVADDMEAAINEAFERIEEEMSERGVSSAS